jgi:hypothetical protein
MRGVRGFGDPRAVTLPSGKPVWYQPDGNGVVLPFRPTAPDLGLQFLEDTPHGWTDTHAAWNHGKYDQWIKNKGRSTMAYLTRRDIPFHYGLADAFTICDAYFCSLMGPTDPNRYHSRVDASRADRIASLRQPDAVRWRAAAMRSSCGRAARARRTHNESLTAQLHRLDVGGRRQRHIIGSGNRR